MLIIAVGIFFAAAFTVLVTEPHFRERRLLKFKNYFSEKAFEPVDEGPVFRRICGYLDRGNLWKK